MELLAEARDPAQKDEPGASQPVGNLAGSEPDVCREKAGKFAVSVRKTGKSGSFDRQTVVVSRLIIGQQ